jgi:hypothetical protein
MKKKLFHLTLLTIFITFLNAIGIITDSNLQEVKSQTKIENNLNQPIIIEDKVLEQTIRKEINKPVGIISKGDMLKIKQIVINNGQKIKSTKGIEAATNAVKIEVTFAANSRITNFSVTGCPHLKNIQLVNINNLEEINLSKNPCLEDIELSNTKKLQSVIINNTSIKKIPVFLYKNCKDLRKVDFSWTKIRLTTNDQTQLKTILNNNKKLSKIYLIAVLGNSSVVEKTMKISPKLIFKEVPVLSESANTSDKDTDKDGLCDDFEIMYKLDPNNSDTDKDGILDGKEVFNQYIDLKFELEQNNKPYVIDNITIIATGYGSLDTSTQITTFGINWILSNVIGGLTDGFQIACDFGISGDVVLTFKIDKNKLNNNDFNSLKLCWYDEENVKMVTIPNQVNDSKDSTITIKIDKSNILNKGIVLMNMTKYNNYMNSDFEAQKKERLKEINKTQSNLNIKN